MKKRRTYTGDFKARVVREYLNGGRSAKDLAEQYRIHPNQIKNWKCRLMQRARLVLEDERRRGEADLALPHGQATILSAQNQKARHDEFQPQKDHRVEPPATPMIIDPADPYDVSIRAAVNCDEKTRELPLPLDPPTPIQARNH